VAKDISWSGQYTLQHLTIGVCSYEEFQLILSHLSQLQTLVLKDCNTYGLNETFLTSSACVNYPQLKSLTIERCSLSIEYLKLAFSLTPSLVYLKLMSDRSLYDSVFDGDFWVEFIQTKLPLLDKFDFVFTYYLSFHYHVPQSFSSLIISFQTPFWLNDKHWFVTYDYVIHSSQHRIIIYTLPEYTTMETETLIRCEASLTDSVRLLNRHGPAGIVTTDDVRIK
jgi:hypothetical protein